MDKRGNNVCLIGEARKNYFTVLSSCNQGEVLENSRRLSKSLQYILRFATMTCMHIWVVM